MRFGLQIPNFTTDETPGALFDGVVAMAGAAEEAGYDSVWVMDHFYQLPPMGGPSQPMLDAYTLLGALATQTERVRLGTMVTGVTYRNPAHLAKIAAGVDLISRGRLTLGIGAGWFDTEYRQYGWEFPERPAIRIRQLEEAVKLILAMWSNKRTTIHGKYFHVEDAILEPKPVQRPHPPVMIAGGGTLRASWIR